MNNEKQMVTITKEEYESLIEDSLMLLALENAGVDNWNGYSDAMAMLVDLREDLN